jgi:hypothetical protein
MSQKKVYGYVGRFKVGRTNVVNDARSVVAIDCNMCIKSEQIYKRIQDN